MNKKLQKWAERKRKTLIKWAEEYDKILTEEDIKGEHIISIALDRKYVGEIHAYYSDNVNLDESNEYLIRTKCWFKEEEDENEGNKR